MIYAVFISFQKQAVIGTLIVLFNLIVIWDKLSCSTLPLKFLSLISTFTEMKIITWLALRFNTVAIKAFIYLPAYLLLAAEAIQFFFYNKFCRGFQHGNYIKQIKQKCSAHHIPTCLCPFNLPPSYLSRQDSTLEYDVSVWCVPMSADVCGYLHI